MRFTSFIPSRAKALSAATVSAALSLLPQAAFAQPRPFGNVNLQQLIGVVIRNVIGLMGIVSVVVFVYAGFLWMTALGDDKQVAKAKSIILYAVIGIFISFASYSLVSFVLSTLETAIQ